MGTDILDIMWPEDWIWLVVRCRCSAGFRKTRRDVSTLHGFDRGLHPARKSLWVISKYFDPCRLRPATKNLRKKPLSTPGCKPQPAGKKVGGRNAVVCYQL
jgi:hypothetical protein